ncbi:large ribosomal subunit protein mL49 [Scleropages formosus]|uniref:Large ribosomal subunit protein mL49 n=1 Tax=Scleropages formosus TaxID=113540 RepID=A0A8C9VRD1_SCLFO|nr:39S ribosomal protein L49, mitochondrial [Scleropages formosus]
MAAPVASLTSRLRIRLKPCQTWLKLFKTALPSTVRLQTTSSTAGERRNTVIVESTEEYKYVERLIPPTQIPTPPHRDGPAPSGWTPPSAVPPALPYMIRRSRMHNIPVYTDITNSTRKTTLVRKIEGDIWALEKDVKEYLEQLTGKVPPTSVNEVTRSIRIKGHYDKELKDWLLKKGF